MTRKTMILTGLAAALALSACDRNRDPKLLHVRSNTSGPDEFAIVPNKPLVQPENLTVLPTPTPNGTNRADVTPLADATIALGGNPQGGVTDSALVAQASRFGVEPGIRTRLAEEDIEFRRKNDGRLLERLFNVNVYFKAYREQSLDQYAELERLRRQGVRTVSAPPEGFEPAE